MASDIKRALEALVSRWGAVADIDVEEDLVSLAPHRAGATTIDIEGLRPYWLNVRFGAVLAVYQLGEPEPRDEEEVAAQAEHLVLVVNSICAGGLEERVNPGRDVSRWSINLHAEDPGRSPDWVQGFEGNPCKHWFKRRDWELLQWLPYEP